jgi:hypothetical protein
MVGVVVVELLVVPDGPNEVAAREALRAAAEVAGLGACAGAGDGDQFGRGGAGGFVGSPTFLIDGVDPFPVAGASTGVAWRMYPTASGPAVVPDAERLPDALSRG